MTSDKGGTHKRSMTVPSHLSEAQVEVIRGSMERAAAELRMPEEHARVSALK